MRAEMNERFDAIDEELSRHADPVHRNLERDVEKLKRDVAALKKRPPAGRSARRRATRRPSAVAI